MNELPCFETLKEMAAEDPEAFEQFRRESCDEYIRGLPSHHRPRLRAIQFRVDHELRRAKNPIAGLLKISGMMHDSFYLLTQKLQMLDDLVQGPADPSAKNAKVVDFDNWKQNARARQLNDSSDTDPH